MFGVILAGIGTFFLEISTTIGKYEVQKRKESIYTMAFLSLIWAFVAFGILIVIKREFAFSLASLPTFTIRVILEIFQVYFVMKAIVLASRTTFSFIRIGTIPLLLLVDIFLVQTAISPFQLAGIAIIIIALSILFMNHGIDKKGLTFVVLTTINAVITISLYKYNITHFNSVEAEQFVLLFILLTYVWISAYAWKRENPIKFLRKRIFLAQSGTYGLGTVFESFAFSFAPASIIIAAKRASAVVWSVISGNVVFHEKHLAIKIGGLILTIIGIILLTIT
jgi:drug/metabolite transporter (DMT)-like permease